MDHRNVLLGELTRKELNEAISSRTVQAAIVPTGATEQHQDHLAMIEIGRQSSSSIVADAARTKAASDDYPEDEELGRQADLLIAKAKFVATNAAFDAADRAMQVLGGKGWSDLYRPGRHWKDARVCRIYEGADEILKLKVVADLLGKEYAAFS